jgi:hypothetical protein
MRLSFSGLSAAGAFALAIVGCSNATTPHPTGSTSSSGAGGGTCGDTGQRPGPRSDVAGALDVKRQKLILFGGDVGLPKQCMPAPHIVDETWVYDLGCKTFTQAMPMTTPPPRERAAAAYDAAGDRMIIFGGRYHSATTTTYTLYNDVWALDLDKLEWSELDMGMGGPPGRSSAEAEIDTQKNELVVFGGNTSTSGLAFVPQNDVWAFSLQNNTWRQVTTSGTPPAKRLFHAGAIDSAGRRLYVYGGGDANAFTGPFLTDLWSLDLDAGAWKELSPGTTGSPRGRINSAFTFDVSADKLLLFGGHDDGAVGNNNDTWAFDLASNAWANLVPAETVKTQPAGFCMFPATFTVPNLSAPDRRSGFGAGFDSMKRTWTIFGGDTDCGIIDDVWQFDASKGAWANQVAATIGEACTRGANPSSCQSLCQ